MKIQLSTLIRCVIRGIVAGGLANLLVLLALPHFFERFVELMLLPVTGAAIGVVIGAIVALIRRSRPEARRAPPGKHRLSFALALALILPIFAYSARSPVRNWRAAPEMIVFCLDGGTWDIIDPLIASGRMPIMAELKRNGVSGTLMSTDPSFTPVVWTTIGTGVRPENHGITSFYATQDYLTAKRFWDVLEEDGRSIGLFRWLVTWPPHVTNGFIIPDILARDARCFPPKYDFVNQLRIDEKSRRGAAPMARLVTGWRFMRSGVRLKTCLAIAGDLWRVLRPLEYADRHIAMRRIEIQLNTDVYCHMLREVQPEYTCFYDNGADVLCHFYWQFFQPELFDDVSDADIARYGNAIPDYYALEDAMFGEIVSHLAPSTTIVVLSDHGSTADREAHRSFYPKAETILVALQMNGDYYGIALGSSTFIESIHTDPEQRSTELARAVERFNEIIVDDGDTRVFDARIYDGTRVLLHAADELTSLEHEVGGESLHEWFITRAKSGTHEPEGIYLFHGRDFRGGVIGETADLLDVAPTVLHHAGLPVSRELEGRVLWSLFSDTFQAEREIAWVDSYGHFDSLRRNLQLDEETRKKLKSLGYIR